MGFSLFGAKISSKIFITPHKPHHKDDFIETISKNNQFLLTKLHLKLWFVITRNRYPYETQGLSVSSISVNSLLDMMRSNLFITFITLFYKDIEAKWRIFASVN